MVYKHFVVHPGSATTPALAACASHLQGRFADMLPVLWERGYRNRRFEQADMEEFAADLGLDLAKFTSDMNGPCRKVVRDDQQHLARVGVRGTPAFFINGRFISGARPADHFRVVIDEELALAKKRIRAGTKVKRYYDTWVLKKGKKSL